MKVKKITLEVPEVLLRQATKASGQGITATIRRGLELVAANAAYAQLRVLKGKVRFGLSLSDLREE